MIFAIIILKIDYEHILVASYIFFSFIVIVVSYPVVYVETIIIIDINFNYYIMFRSMILFAKRSTVSSNVGT